MTKRGDLCGEDADRRQGPCSSHTRCTAEDQAAGLLQGHMCLCGHVCTPPGWCATIRQSWVGGADLMWSRNRDILTTEPLEKIESQALFRRQSCDTVHLPW